MLWKKNKKFRRISNVKKGRRYILREKLSFKPEVNLLLLKTEQVEVTTAFYMLMSESYDSHVLYGGDYLLTNGIQSQVWSYTWGLFKLWKKPEVLVFYSIPQVEGPEFPSRRMIACMLMEYSFLIGEFSQETHSITGIVVLYLSLLPPSSNRY
jgi:hypothetical protein